MEGKRMGLVVEGKRMGSVVEGKRMGLVVEGKRKWKRAGRQIGCRAWVRQRWRGRYTGSHGVALSTRRCRRRGQPSV